MCFRFDIPWAVGEARALHVATGILKSPKVGLLLGVDNAPLDTSSQLPVREVLQLCLLFNCFFAFRVHHYCQVDTLISLPLFAL